MACEPLFRMLHAYRAVSVIDFKPGARCAPPGMLRCPPTIHFRVSHSFLPCRHPEG
jgi:hypothetical protein